MPTRAVVADVMTANVVTVRPDTGYQHIVNLLIGHEVSAVPVVDDENRVLGVVSEGDLATKVEFAAMWPVTHGQSQHGRRRTVAKVKSMADTAAALMTAPAVTIDSRASLAAAARVMADADVKRLPVVDSQGRLVGIVSRRDLLRTHLRSDLQIRQEVAEVLGGWFHLQPGQTSVAVVDGVVTLVGEVADRRQAELAVKFVGAIDGVVDVVDGLVVQRMEQPAGTPAQQPIEQSTEQEV